ncbi:MAG TPA: hypothetical protein VLD57_12435, partial [Blastocatellia bacterium]|nr:hypothetical protein [Blastocatellia bacterium]
MMLRESERRLAPACLLALLALIATACHARSEESSIAAPLPDGEPESYSATVVRTFEVGDGKQVVVTRVARSGQMLREE